MRSREEGDTAQLTKVRVKERIRRLLERDAQARKTTINAVVADRLEASFAETDYSPELAALGEMLARVMDEAGNAITGANRWAGYGKTYWLNDGYAYDQALKAALRVLILGRPPAPRAPHGLFSTLNRHLARTVGRQVADGVLEQLRGRETGTASHWVGRVRDKLGVVATRLCQQTAPPEFFLSQREDGPLDDFLQHKAGDNR
jgi:hypothetical protein